MSKTRTPQKGHKLKMPKKEKEEIFLYLDELRESGVTNMWGSPKFVQQTFNLTWDDAKAIVIEWMRLKESGKR